MLKMLKDELKRKGQVGDYRRSCVIYFVMRDAVGDIIIN